MRPIWQLDAVSVHFGRHAHAVCALSEISFQLMPGERVALIGANGCGKSTLLRLLHALLTPTTGTLACDATRPQAMLFQRAHLLRCSVQNNIALGLWLRGTPWRAAREQALLALAHIGLTALAKRNARQLSAGQQQRVALARAWALGAQVWLLDEPTASLDPHAKREVEALIDTFANASPAMTLVLASHNLGQVKRLASRVIYLECGRILADLPVHDFFNGPLLQTHYPAAHRFIKGELA